MNLADQEAETKAEAESAHAEVAVAMGMTRFRKGSDSPGDAAFATQARPSNTDI